LSPSTTKKEKRIDLERIDDFRKLIASFWLSWLQNTNFLSPSNQASPPNGDGLPPFMEVHLEMESYFLLFNSLLYQL
jgi:hypothetical protein